MLSRSILIFFFFNDTATTEIYTLSLHDALPIWTPARPRRLHGETPLRCRARSGRTPIGRAPARSRGSRRSPRGPSTPRSEEHTSELQSRQYLVCRLLLEKKNKIALITNTS